MKKSTLFAASIILMATLGLSSCGKTKFRPFEIKDSGPKIWLQSGINQMENGDFSQKEKHWGTFKTAGGNANIDFSAEKAVVQIKNAGAVEYSVQLYYDGFRIYHDGQYTLSFKASAEKPKGCEVRIQLNGGDYHPYIVDTLTFTPEEREYKMSFTMTDDTDTSPRLAFNMGSLPEFDEGSVPNTVTIRDVSIVLNNSIVEEEASNGGADIVRVNQIGFKPADKKFAYVKVDSNGKTFSVLNSSKETVYSGKLGKPVRDEMAQEYVAPADFSSVTEPGIYTVIVDDAESFPFAINENPYSAMIQDALRFFTLARCGTEVEDPIFGHPACHTGQAKDIETYKMLDILGGWHDAGDYGRYVVPAAKTVADLLFAHDNLDGIISFDILDEVRWELDWLLQMQKADGSVYHKITCTEFPAFEMPELETAGLYLSKPSTAAAANFVGTLALASVYYKNTDASYADKLLQAAKKSWAYLEENPYKPFKNEGYIYTGEYPDDFDGDERYFAATALALATGESSYAQEAEKIRADSGENWLENFGWEQMEGYGDHIILNNPSLFSDSLVKQVKKAVKKQANQALANIKKSGFKQAQTTVNWGSNMEAMNIAHLLTLAGTTFSKDSYNDAAKNQLDYILGANPLSRCFVTGYGSNSPVHPHHRPSIAKDTPQKGMLVGGPDQNLEDEFALNLVSDKPDLQCYVDHYQSFSTNEVTIYWNSPLVYILSVL